MKRASLLVVALAACIFTITMHAAVIFSEGFNDAAIPATWTIVNVPAGVSSLATITSGSSPTASPYEGARCLRFNSYSVRAGTNAHLISPAISTEDRTNIVVSFCMASKHGLCIKY